MTDGPDLQRRAAVWRRERPKVVTRMAEPTPAAIMTKLLEEAGEVGRAVLGWVEGRSDRGDPVHEAAQVVFVLLAYVGIYHPDQDLFEAVETEVRKAERELEMRRLVLGDRVGGT